MSFLFVYIITLLLVKSLHPFSIGIVFHQWHTETSWRRQWIHLSSVCYQPAEYRDALSPQKIWKTIWKLYVYIHVTPFTIQIHRIHYIHVQCIHVGSTGTFSRANVPPGRYVLRIEAKDITTEEKNVISTAIELDGSEDHCTTHLINRGLRVEGQTLTVEFNSTGRFNGFTCTLNRDSSQCMFHHDKYICSSTCTSLGFI